LDLSSGFTPTDRAAYREVAIEGFVLNVSFDPKERLALPVFCHLDRP
jgi:hypothetical protein